MISIIWMLLNAALAALFIVLCYKATKAIKQQVGIGAALFFVLCLLSFNGKPEKEEDKKPMQAFTPRFTDNQELLRAHKGMESVVLDDRTTFDITLGVTYGYSETQKKLLPISGYSTEEGFTSGQKWNPTGISLTKTEPGNQLHYSVNGMIEWRLLNWVIYRQPKVYKGTIALDGAIAHQKF